MKILIPPGLAKGSHRHSSQGREGKAARKTP